MLCSDDLQLKTECLVEKIRDAIGTEASECRSDRGMYGVGYGDLSRVFGISWTTLKISDQYRGN